jgi:hypothetical protein
MFLNFKTKTIGENEEKFEIQSRMLNKWNEVHELSVDFLEFSECFVELARNHQ